MALKNEECHVVDVVIVRSALSWRFVRCGRVETKEMHVQVEWKNFTGGSAWER